MKHKITQLYEKYQETDDLECLIKIFQINGVNSEPTLEENKKGSHMITYNNKPILSFDIPEFILEWLNELEEPEEEEPEESIYKIIYNKDMKKEALIGLFNEIHDELLDLGVENPEEVIF